MTLKDAKVGSTVKVISVDESPMKQRLMSMGEILRAAFLGDPIAIRLRAYNLAIRKKDAEKILVAEV